MGYLWGLLRKANSLFSKNYCRVKSIPGHYSLIAFDKVIFSVIRLY